MLNKYLSIITLSIVLCAFSEAQASGVNGSFQVSATVSASCSVSTNDLNFGNYNSGQNGDLDATGQLGVACTNDTSYTIDVGTGL
ncbi:MAG: fimbrial major subunit CsuA/B family protein, partial [Nitrospinaceae bacterium]|nr:fimbrial major subunit CsuA/B family protein [Nitrospinaceae bacterium]